MKLDKNQERVWLESREQLARLVGTLLGCHAGHRFDVNAGDLTLTLPIKDLPCVTDSGVPYRVTIKPAGPPPPPPRPIIPPRMPTPPRGPGAITIGELREMQKRLMRDQRRKR